MKKILSVLLLIFTLFNFGMLISASETPTTIVVHYYRYDGNYTNFNFWLWQHEPQSMGGKQHNFNTENIGDYGVFIEIDLKSSENVASYPDASRFGIIIKQGGWDGYREIGGDRFFNLADMEIIDGKGHVYFIEQEIRVGLSSTDLDYGDRILTAAFDKQKRAVITATAIPESYEIFENSTLVSSGTSTSKTLTITIPNVNISKTYTAKLMFEGNQTSEMKISIHNLYDTPEFESLYTYHGDLGLVFEEEFTIFRVWAPLSESVRLNLYHQGHSHYNDQGQASIELTPFETVDMVKIENGAWEARLTGDYLWTYYTFSVTNSGVTHEVTDPYAYSTGANGQRGMVVDFSQLNPEGWTYGERPNTIKNHTDYIIWELHVRDLTTHSSWQGTESYRGKFLGITERGTSYTHSNGVTVTTGLDHIIELGVNAVQFIPLFDFGYVDEIEVALNPNYTNTFNWGYMPYHFNTLEGSYATNPFDGRTRIQEFKQVVQTLHDHDIRLIMDVVYNHTGESESSNFHRIVPGYYHRLTPTGGFSNGSGTGNETASERSMVRKFMLDSIEFWANEYSFSGFRFDLMELHDVQTMNDIADLLESIDPTIIVFGEPWMGGTSPLPNNIRAGKDNMSQMPNVGAFNDIYRDAIKGSVFVANERGWIHGNTSEGIVNGLKYGIVGGVGFPGITGGFHHYPNQNINYATAHDNNTLYDKTILTGFRVSRDLDKIKAMQIQANALVLTSQGVSFLHAGVEFMRSKPLEEGGFDHNSYESPDSVNQLRWDRKAQYHDVFEYYKTLIQIRKSYDHFRMTSPQEIRSRLSFLDTDGGLHGIAYKIEGNLNEPEIIVVHSGNPQFGLVGVQLTPGKQYRLLTYVEDHNINGIEIISNSVFVPSNTTSILIEVLNPSITLNSDVVTINKGQSFNPLSNVTIRSGLDDQVTLYHSTYHNINRPGYYTITVAVLESYGLVSHYHYTLHVRGNKYEVTVQ